MNPAKLLTSYRHTGIALADLLAQIVALGVLSGTALHVTQIVLLVLHATTTAAVSNVPHQPKVAGERGQVQLRTVVLVLLIIALVLLILLLVGHPVRIH